MEKHSVSLMPISMDWYPLFSIVISLLVVMGSILRLRLGRKARLPPGPKGWPVIGNMSMMDRLTHRGLAGLAKDYGGILHLRMGNLHMVHVSSPDIAKQVLQVQDHVFSNRPATIAIRYLTYDRADMAFAHYGPFWRQMRKLCVVKLFSRKRAESWASVRDQVVSTLRVVNSSLRSPVNVGELVFNLTKNITYQAAFGTASDEAQDEFVAILQEFSKLFGAFNVADFIPWLNWVDPNGLNSRLAKARTALDKFIDSIIDQHVNNPKNADDIDSDMVDELLAFYSDVSTVNESDDLHNAIRLTRDNIKAIIMDVMFGGTETVASAIEWAMAELMRSPGDMTRAQEELNRVVGLDRGVAETDLDKLGFLKAVVKETLRLHPPIPLLLHETSADAVVGGFSIPAKSRVMINAWAIGRDPDSWVDPNVFNPSRFMEDGMPDFKGSSFEFIPFGSGRRSCPGMQLGLYALELCVANLVHSFKWELPGGMKPEELDMEDVFGLTAPRKTRLMAVPTPRLSCPPF